MQLQPISDIGQPSISAHESLWKEIHCYRNSLLNRISTHRHHRHTTTNCGGQNSGIIYGSDCNYFYEYYASSAYNQFLIPGIIIYFVLSVWYSLVTLISEGAWIDAYMAFILHDVQRTLLFKWYKAGSLEAEFLRFQATGRQHRECIIPQAVTHSLVLLKMGGINARNMLSWLELLINQWSQSMWSVLWLHRRTWMCVLSAHSTHIQVLLCSHSTDHMDLMMAPWGRIPLWSETCRGNKNFR